MSTTDVPDDYELVVADDGSIAAEQITRLGLGPGAHLRVVPASEAWSPRRKTAKGILAGKVDGEALVGALQDARGERVVCSTSTSEGAGGLPGACLVSR